MKDKHIVITGGASGIGAACASAFARRGARITVLDRHRPEALCDQFIPIEMSDADSIDEAAGQVREPIDVLCNVAGLPPRKDSGALVLKVNFLGLRQLTERLLRTMAPQSSMVSIASRAGSNWRDNLSQIQSLMGLPGVDQADDFIVAHKLDGTQAYNLSKQAVIAWTIGQTAQWFKLGLRANTVSPGAVSTGILNDFLTAFGDRASSSIARVGRPANAVEVASVIEFLAGQESAWIRGVDVPIDGGMGAMAISEQLNLASAVAGADNISKR